MMNSNKISYTDAKGDIIEMDVNKFNQLDKIFCCKRLNLFIVDNSVNYSNLKYFSDLKSLRLNDSTMIKIPPEICQMENLYDLSINLDSKLGNMINNVIFYKDKAIIRDWKFYFRDRPNLKDIKDLKILNCNFDELINLPENLSILRLGIHVKNYQIFK